MIEKEVKIKLKKEEIGSLKGILDESFRKQWQRNEEYLACPLKCGYVRLTRDEDPIVTVKSVRKKGKYNIREEKSFDVNKYEKREAKGQSWEDPSIQYQDVRVPSFNMGGFFPALCRASGIEKPILVKRTRTTYSAKGTVICLDNLANGDSYIEIECKQERDIEPILKTLHLQNRKNETRPYYEIVGGKHG